MTPRQDFLDLLSDCQMSRTMLATELGLDRSTVYHWQTPPHYAMAFLTERKKNLALEKTVATLKETIRLMKE